MKRWLSLTAVIAAVGFGHQAAAQDASADAAERTDAAKSICLSAFADTQRLRESGALTAAREQVLVCARDSCPGPVATQCVVWLDELDASLPTVVFAVKAVADHDGGAVRVTEGDRVVAERLDGAAVVIHPGPRTLRFEDVDGKSVSVDIVLYEGQKNRIVEVELWDEPPPVADGGLSPLVWVGFGLGGAGLVAGTITGVLALNAASSTEDRCADEGCTQDDIDAEVAVAHVSTVAFAVGGAGIVLGVVGLLVGGDDEVALETGAVRWSPVALPHGMGVSASF